MITLLLLLLGLIIALGYYFTFKDRTKEEEYREYGETYTRTIFNPKPIIISFVIFLVFLIVGAIQPYTIEKIDAGNVGLKVNLTGDKRGVSKSTYVSGWNMYNTWTADLHQYPTTQQTIEYPEQQVITKGGFAATIHPTFNYSIVAGSVSDMFQNLRLDIKSIEQGWLKNAITSSVNDVANIWEVDSIFNHRAAFEAAIVVECNARVSKWFTVSQLKTNIVPPPALQAAIEGKTKAIQEAQAAIQRKQVAEAEAQEKIAIAKGDSAQAVIAASGEAAATKLKQQQLTPLFIEYMKIKKWDGQLPTTTTGNAGALINIK
jgi:regulator of protease activity HflC (stomatin/prohibitin superfamily)